MPTTSPLLSLAGLADRYAIERELRRGGMATVYLAEELKHARQVAIKVLHPELAASLGAERFHREIGIAARLTHPHIVPLIDSGETDGTLYYVSPYIDGGSLRDRLDREHRLSLDDALRIVEEVGAGLDCVHRAGYVHRDVKPENILLADGHALLADFGIARACAACEPAESLTTAGIAVGTPEYMSPEQATGERELDGASDIYSLGCVLYEMLAGEPPHRGTTPRATMAKHVTERARSVRELRPEVPAGVDAAIARALSKDPAIRFATVVAFVAALRADQTPSGHVPAVASRSIAVLPFVNASPDPENEYLSDGITDELIDALAKLDQLRVASRTSAFALKGRPQDIRAVGALLGVSVVLEGTVRRSGTRLRITAQLTSTDDGRLLWSQRYDRELHDVLAIQDEIAQTIVNTLRATSLVPAAESRPRRYTDDPAAYALFLRGRYALNKRTAEGVAEGIEYFRRAIAEDPSFALAYTGLADAYALHVDYRSVPVTEGMSRAKDYARRALELDDTLPEAHASLAWSTFIHDWDWPAAAGEFRRAIELEPRYATAHQWYAFLLMAMGRRAEALVEGHTAQELDPGSVSIRRTLAFLYFYARQYERARYHLARAVEMNPTAEETYRVLGLTLSIEEQHGEAERVLREAVTMPGSGSYTLATLGYALARAGRRDEALAIGAELDRRRQAGYVSPTALSTLQLGLGNVRGALDWLEAAHAERRGWVVYVNVNPIFDPLRDEPRFAALRGSMRLDGDSATLRLTPLVTRA